jgi:hypothetical protein
VPGRVTAGEDCGAREADAAGAADEVDVARGGGSCRCTPEELLEHPVKTALLNATTARMVTRTTRLMLSTSSHEHVYPHQGVGNFGPRNAEDAWPHRQWSTESTVLAKEKHPNWNGTTTKTA